MAFSQQVRTDALISAARHCCVCHRYRGVKVEVHHIVPVTKGGSDTADNAIALCFDCHADAGHYNPEHPRGTKFSAEELRRARDMWHLAVQHNRIEAPRDEDWLYCRYLVCKSFSSLWEIAEGNLKQLPFGSGLLARTVAGDFLSSIVRKHETPHRLPRVWGDSFADRNEYERVRPEVRIFERRGFNFFPYFEASRTPSREEMVDRIAPRDPLTELLLKAGVPDGEISEVLAYEEKCGQDCFQETYLLRPLWGVYLAVTNTTERPIRLHAVKCESERPSGFGFRSFRTREGGGIEDLSLPAMPLPPNASVVIPIAAMLGPMGAEPFNSYRGVSVDVPTGEIQTIAHADGGDVVNRLALVGPSLWPISLTVEDRGTRREQEIHQLDFSNLYTVDRSWEAGSCPHLFLDCPSTSSLTYWGELWARAPDKLQVETLEVPQTVSALLLAELEDEVTHVFEVTVNGRAVFRDRVLHRGDTLRIAVQSGDNVRLAGRYVPRKSVRDRKPDPWWKNEIIATFIRSHARRVGTRSPHLPLAHFDPNSALTAVQSPVRVTAGDLVAGVAYTPK